MAVPVRLTEVADLAALGVTASCVKFGTCGMESDSFVTVCDSSDAATQVYLVELATRSVTKRPINAEAAIMNPVSKVLALRAGSQLQIFNLELRAKMSSATLEGVVYWRWTSTNTIALVTPTSVFHWAIDDQPVKVFDRHASLGEGTQIINYQVSSDHKWCLLVGIAQQAGTTKIQGTMQLFSLEKKVSQILQGHAGCFHSMKVSAADNSNGPPRTAQILCFEEQKKPLSADSSSQGGPPKLFVMEVGRDKDAPGGVFRLAPVPIPVPADAANDFPVAMLPDPKYDVLFMITKMGYLYMFDAYSGKALYRARITTDTVFVTCPADPNSGGGGIVGVTARRGQVLRASLNEATLVPYVVSTLGDHGLAIALASRLQLPGADDLYQSEFARLTSLRDVAGAAKLAAESPRGLLRTQETIDTFLAIPGQPGQPQPVFQYFHALLEKGKLNAFESIALARPVVQQGRAQFLEKWLTEEKLECTEDLGDLVRQEAPHMALSVYLRAGNAPGKVIQLFLERGEFDKIAPYASKVGYDCDYGRMLASLPPQPALEFAKHLSSQSLIDPNAVVDLFMGQAQGGMPPRVQETTAFLLEALKSNKPEEGYLQTKLLEINLRGGNPQVADAILQNQMFTHYDRRYVAQLCEAAGLPQRALEHYTDVDDIKRSLVSMISSAARGQGPPLNVDFVLSYFGSLSPEASLACLKELLQRDAPTNVHLCAQIAAKYSEQIGSDHLVALFESFRSYEGLFHYLGRIVNFSQEPNVHYKYVEAAARTANYDEVERVCRDSTVYDPKKVKDFLTEAKLADPRPLIHVCDRHGFVDEMTQYLYENKLTKYIEVYCHKVSPQHTPVVVGKLLDLDVNEDFIRTLLNSVGHACPVDDLVEQVERRNRLRLLQPWLEARVATGNQEAATHNAIGKIYVTLNRHPASFLTNDPFYDPKVLGEFCEKLDPSLAFLAYKRANGHCDDDLVRVARANGLFKDLARYLVQRQDPDLWHRVLLEREDDESNNNDDDPRAAGIRSPTTKSSSSGNRRQLIDQVVGTALPETSDPEQVSSTVRAFMAADLPHELIELLERVVLQNSDFCRNKNLQNLLILTAIKADKDRVMEYVNRLDNFDGPAIAKIAISDQYALYEEGFVIYTKFAAMAAATKNNNRNKGPDKTAGETNNLHDDDDDDDIDQSKKKGDDWANLEVRAMGVLVDHLRDFDRAQTYAEKVNLPLVWSRLGTAQLRECPTIIPVAEAIASYLKAADASRYVDVIDAVERGSGDPGSYESLVRFLAMARKTIKEPLVDTSLVYAYAKTEQLGDLDQFLRAPNVASILAVGERCFDEDLFAAAKILFASIHNNAKVALCDVNLMQFREAVDAAAKANSVSTWKEVSKACVRAGEFRLAMTAGLEIMIHPDHLEDLIALYESEGRTEELLALMERGLGLDQAHAGIFTALGILYSKFKPEKLMEHITLFWSRINTPKLLRACEVARLWDETVFLLKEDEQFDSAVKTMIDHATAFQDDLFLECVQKVRNQEVLYKAVACYVEQRPSQLVRLLHIVAPRVDHARVVHLLRRFDVLALALPYLKAIQKDNLTAVNEALNDLYVEDEDYDALGTSTRDFDNFDHIALAQRTEKHELLEFRRIAGYIYKKNKRYHKALQLSKADKMYKDAIDTCAEARDPKLTEDLLRFFVDVCDKECFCATLFTCYKDVTPDVALELAWRNSYTDYVMPYVIQYARHLHDDVQDLKKHHIKRLKDDELAKNKTEQQPPAALMGGGAIYGDPTAPAFPGGPPLLPAAAAPYMVAADPLMMGPPLPPPPPQMQAYPTF